jgi:hypothetical protein
MASPIRTFFLGLLAVSIFAYGFFVFEGGFAIQNNLPINPALQSQYLAITGNSSTYGGVIGPVAGLQQTAQANQKSLGNPNPLSTILNSIGLASSFFGTLTALFQSIILFAAIPLSLIGIPAGLAYGISLVGFVGLIGLGIVSAIFLFPI